tara:strand:+ start:28999 stop:29697 length:699 start_codon:yes stop_codon:yes gene_type:complete
MFSQTDYEFQIIENDTNQLDYAQLRDSLYSKNLNYNTEREIKGNLKEKYTGPDFTYVDDLKEPVKAQPRKPINISSGNGFVFFMSNIFPLILAAIVILIILKSFVNIDPRFWMMKSKSKLSVTRLDANDENIDDTDFEELLKKAIKSKDYRLATRYYYLSLLQYLSEKKHIEYHKDKTNSDYLFELKDQKMKTNFSYLSYVYSYVWYGEFPLNEFKFVSIEKKYQSFLKTIK